MFNCNQLQGDDRCVFSYGLEYLNRDSTGKHCQIELPETRKCFHEVNHD